jgi:hypothetical protein
MLLLIMELKKQRMLAQVTMLKKIILQGQRAGDSNLVYKMSIVFRERLVNRRDGYWRLRHETRN